MNTMKTTSDFHPLLCPRCGQSEHGALSCVDSASLNKTFAQSFEELQAALEAKVVKCPHCLTEDVLFMQLCSWCKGVGTITDPIFAPLLALAREKCPVAIEWPIVHSDLAKPCWACNDIGYINRADYWLAAPKGALRGALEEALPNGYSLHRYGTNTEVWETVAGSITRVAGAFGTDDTAALEAVLEWVKGVL